MTGFGKSNSAGSGREAADSSCIRVEALRGVIDGAWVGTRPIAGGEYIILSALKQPLALFAPVTNGACYLPGL